MLTYEQNLKAIIDSHLTEVKDEIKDSIIDNILRLKAPKRGSYAEWINPAYDWLQCSRCGYTTSAKSRFCPGCGAEMEVET